MPTTNRAILVTGSHRSGTTWVGQMIASHPRVVYLSEPFNLEHPGTPVRHWFHDVTRRDDAAFRAYLTPLLTFRHSWTADFLARPGPRRLVGATLRKLGSLARHLGGCRPLLKDPIALFSAGWLADTFPTDVVVLVRHPAAFASSLKQLGWRFPFGHLLAQEELMAGRLAPFAAEVCRFAATEHDILDQANLLWRIFHHVILLYQRTRPGWSFVRHEDLSLDPVGGFERLFRSLGLTGYEKVRRTIEAHTSSENPRDAAPGVVHELRRNSRANVWSWRDRLTTHEVRRVREATADVAVHFYADDDWEPGPPAGADAA